MQTSTMVALLLSATSLNQQTGDRLTSGIKHHGCSTLYDSHSRKHDALSKGRKVRRADLGYLGFCSCSIVWTKLFKSANCLYTEAKRT
jgi:hypothetical protein